MFFANIFIQDEKCNRLQRLFVFMAVCKYFPIFAYCF